MELTLSWQAFVEAVIGLSAFLAAVIAIFKYYNKAYNLVKHQEAQDYKIRGIEEELAVIVNAQLACLKGLHEMGCNGPVTAGIASLEEHINKKAHGI